MTEWRFRFLCSHCGNIVSVAVPHVSEGMTATEMEAFGRAVFEARMVHAFLDCEALVSSAEELDG